MVSFWSETLKQFYEGDEPENPLTLENSFKADFLLKLWQDKFPESSVPKHDDWLDQLQARNLYKESFPTQTIFGEIYGDLMLSNGATSSKSDIEMRTNLIKAFATNSKLTDEVVSLLRDIKSSEDLCLHLLNPVKALKARMPHARGDLAPKEMSAWPILSQPLKSASLLFKSYYYFIGLWVSYTELKTNLSSYRSQPTWGGFFGHSLMGLLTSVSSSALIYYQLDAHARLQAEHALVVGNLKNLSSVIHRVFDLLALAEFPGELALLSYEQRETLKSLMDLADGLAVPSGSHLFQADLLRALTAMDHALAIRNDIQAMLLLLGKADFYASVGAAVAKKDSGITYVKWLSDSRPVIESVGLTHPLLAKSKAIGNALNIGENDHAVVLTGPNASGKSTLMRALGINVIALAQTLGLAFAESLSLTPFDAFHVFMETKDVLGQSSSYETEVNRMVDALKLKSQLSESGQKSLLLADELFSSTNAVDALIGSKEILVRLSRLDHSMSLVSTHLYDLSKVDNSAGTVRNMHMENFKLKPGASSARNGMQLVHSYLGL
ncbi:MAG: hypothetical protein V4534_03020 [Myxococcota bacterium]